MAIIDEILNRKDRELSIRPDDTGWKATLIIHGEGEQIKSGERVPRNIRINFSSGNKEQLIESQTEVQDLRIRKKLNGNT